MTLTELRRDVLEMLRPPSRETVSEWAERNLRIPDGNPEAGPYRTDRAPYQKEIMDSMTQTGVHDIALMTAAQIGKTLILTAFAGRMIDLDPGPTLLVFPAEDDVDQFAKERLWPTIRQTPVLNKKVYGGQKSGIRFVNFRAGFISTTGAMSPGGLKSRPVQNLLCDEVDGYPASAGVEGDPITLAQKRTVNFTEFATRFYSSTPTLKNTSRIYRLFLKGTQEEWEFPCKECGVYHHITFDNIIFEKTAFTNEREEKEYEVHKAWWACPDCGGIMTEYEVKRSEGKWVPYHPGALAGGWRSFHLTSFMSPWAKWIEICKKFLDGKDDPEMLKAFYNTELGLPYEHKDRTAIPELMYLRREHYDAEVPNGVIVITIGIDTQDNRLEYEVVGWGREEESWGIEYGVIPGRADEESTWEQVDALIDREWKLENGRAIRAAVIFQDAGGHLWDAVMDHCGQRRMKRMYAVRGDNKDTGTLVRHTKNTKRGQNYFILNVYVGKRAVLYNAGIQDPGPRYMHYPDDEERGYTENYFKGLISEQVKPVKKRGGVYVEEWVKVYERNEPLDCRNYARCAFKSHRIDLDAIEKKLYAPKKILPADTSGRTKRPRGLISEGIKV